MSRNRHGIPVLRDVAATKRWLLDSDPRTKRKRARPKPPLAKPPWLDAAEYEQLLALRRTL